MEAAPPSTPLGGLLPLSSLHQLDQEAAPPLFTLYEVVYELPGHFLAKYKDELSPRGYSVRICIIIFCQGNLATVAVQVQTLPYRPTPYRYRTTGTVTDSGSECTGFIG